MSNPFASTKTEEKVTQEKDTLGGSFIKESGAYPATITMAYAIKSKGGAGGFVMEFKFEDGTTFKTTEWVTSGDEKGNKNYYERDGEKFFLPGYNIANAISLLGAQKELHELTFEEKLVKIYNPDAKTDVPTKTQVAVDLLGAKVILGILKQTRNKSAETSQGSGIFKDTNEKRDENVIDKVFHAETKKTIKEYRDKVEEAAFYEPWVERNKGKTRNRFKEVAGAPAAGATKGAPSAGKPVESLFD